MRNIVTKQESLVKDGQWDTNPKNMLKSSLLLERFKNSIYYSQNNQSFRKETETKNGGKNISKNTGDNGGSSWKIIAPECGKYWTK